MPTKIEWCDACLNAVWGCTRACPYCYAYKVAHRFADMIAAKEGKYRGWPSGSVGETQLAGHMRRFIPVLLESNLHRKFPKKTFRIFVNSMSDIADWRPEWIDAVAGRIANDPDRYYLFLTKRPQVYQDNFSPFGMKNILRGMTLTGDRERDFSYGRGVAPLAFVQFVSIEPLHGDAAGVLHLFPNLKWIIVGAETGKRKGKVYPCPEWIRSIVAYAESKNIPIFMKESLRTYCDGKNLEFIQQHCV
jgi:protein gp37